MSDKLERKRKELELLEAEQAFAEKKASGKVTVEDKLALVELRRDFRENYRQAAKAGAQPAAVKAKVG